MYLANIKLWNFRKFGSNQTLTLDLPDLNLNFKNGLNVIIGENDSGKTAIIDAIKLVLKTHSYDYIRLQDDDFFKDSDRFRIELIFRDLADKEASHFTEWLAFESSPNDSQLPFLRLIFDVKRTKERILPADVKAGADTEGYPLNAEAREYLKTTYLKPLRDAQNELISKRNSRLAQILLGDVAFKGKDDSHELVDLFNQLNTDLTDYFKGNLTTNGTQPQEGKAIKDKIDSFVQSFYGSQSEVEFSASDNNLKNILEKLTLGITGEINLGLGTLNRLFMATELLHLKKQNWSGLRLGLIEELEAHLHPQAQMQVVETLQKETDIQLILTSHSPNLVSKLRLENLIFCHGSNAFPMGTEYTKLEEDNYKFLEKFLDTTKANLFFAKGVIFVEGWSEEILIPSLAKMIGIDLTKEGISIVNIGNVGFDNYTKIYLRENQPDITMPVAVITDSDIRYYEKVEGSYQVRNVNDIQTETEAKIAELKAKSSKKIKYFPAPSWTLEFSLLKSSSLQDKFKTVLVESHTGTNWDSNYEMELGKKLINKGLNKTDIACRLANYIDEDIQREPSEREIVLNEDDTYISYLLEAIRYVTNSQSDDINVNIEDESNGNN